METCNLTRNEELKYVAKNFTSFLLAEELIHKGKLISNEKLINLYRKFQEEERNLSRVQTSQIKSALNQIKVLSRNVDSSQGVRFKDTVFQNATYLSGPVQNDQILRPRVRVFTNQSYTFRNTTKREKDIAGRSCNICCLYFTTNEEVQKHVQSELHIFRSLFRRFPHTKNELPLNLDFLEVNNIDVCLDTKETKDFVLKFKNVHKNGSAITFLRCHELKKMVEIVTSCTLPKLIKPDETFEFTMTVHFAQYKSYEFPIVFVIQEATALETCKLLSIPKFKVLMKEFQNLAPSIPFRYSTKNKVIFKDLPIVSGIPLPSYYSIKYQIPLAQYPIPGYLNNFINRGFKCNEESESDKEALNNIRKIFLDPSGLHVLPNKDGLHEKNYCQRFRFLLWIEEHQMNKDIHAYNQEDSALIREGIYHKLQIPGLSENRPSILRGDSVFVIPKNSKFKYEGVVHVVEKDHIKLRLADSFCFMKNEKVDIEFSLHRISLRICHRAIDQVEKKKLMSYLFPKNLGKDIFNIHSVKLRNEKLAANEQQKQAVLNIVRNTAFPAPYIIYGPPGTGKTSTVVEAITQLYLYRPNLKICACAPSNSAADLIAIRLLQFVPKSFILRIYSISRSPKDIPEDLKDCSNFNRYENYFPFPQKEIIQNKTIIIVTPISAGRVYGVAGHFFDYLFIDEAGYAEEPVSLIPIMGLLKRNPIKNSRILQGSLILSGDPKQLGPIVHSSLAVHLGLNVSIVERLMNTCSLYKKNPVTNEYNTNVITKLIKNYRSHSSILQLPNKLFYDNELIAVADEAIVNSLCSWDELPKRNFPVIFHGVKGKEDRERNSPSYFNTHEIQIIINYLTELIGKKVNGYTVKAQDVVILTPYRKQVEKFRIALRAKKLDKLIVKSVEEFQGQESKIVVISTVRSRAEFLASDYQFGLGFLRNPKRFNVAITRAIALMIIVGNPDILQTDIYWRELINYIRINGSYKGEEPSGQIEPDLDPNKTLALDLSALTINADNIPKSEKPGFHTYD